MAAFDKPKSSAAARSINRKDVKIIDGGYIKVPGNVNFGINFDCPQNTVYACMAESFILGMSNYKGNFCIGREIDLGLIEEIGKMATKCGFEVVM